MEELKYGFKKVVDLTFEEAVEKITASLKGEGFGILTEIDVKSTLKKKIDKDFTKYKILGACNPNMAYEAFNHEIDIGLLLPCNVVVYENPSDHKTIVGVIDPKSMLATTGRDDLSDFANIVQQKLKTALSLI